MMMGWLTPSSPIFINFHWQSSWSAAWMKYLRTQSKNWITLLSSSVLYLPSVHRSAWSIVRTTWPLLPENPLNHFNRPTWLCVFGGGCSLYCNRIMLRKKSPLMCTQKFQNVTSSKGTTSAVNPSLFISALTRVTWIEDGVEFWSWFVWHSTAPVQLYSPYSVV